ncbi:MAG: rhomboid family intramembrane serine protease [Myxococcota bacterium]
MSEGSPVRLRASRRRRWADEWALVLLAEGLHPTLRQEGRELALWIPAEEAEAAAGALQEYEREERDPGPERLHADLEVGAAVALGLLGFFLALGGAQPADGWLERGSADAARILGGELWRTLTALTLHADLRHVGANALLGGFLLAMVCAVLGRGLGLCLVLLAGAAGNAVNALLYASQHVSVGASTAVFGALGLLVGLGVRGRHRRRMRGRRAWAPLGAGLALLAFLGTGEGRVDVWAHFWGFVAGAVLALAVAFTSLDTLGTRSQRILTGVAALAMVGCWTLAWLRP